MLLVWPHPLCCDWSYGSIPLLESLADLRSFAPVCITYGLPAALLSLASSSAVIGISLVLCGQIFEGQVSSRSSKDPFLHVQRHVIDVWSSRSLFPK